MIFATVSKKGQLTIPTSIRKLAHIQSGTRVAIELRGDEIILRPLKSLRELAGVFHEQSKGHEESYEEIHQQTMETVANEVAHEGLP